jgi:exoribonuclease-2
VTSPLRRYQDLLAHYQIHAVLAAANKLERNNAPSEPDLLISADTMNERLFRYSNQAAKNRQAERDSRAHWTLVYLSMNPDWRGEGIVLDASAETGQIFIPQFGYEFQTRIPRGIHVDSRVSLALRRVSVPDLFASFDILPQGT